MEKETLYKFFDGKASREEKEAVRIWLESSPENEQELFKEREFFDAMILSGSTKVAGMEKKSRPFYRTVLLEAIKIAAVFAITVASGTYFYKSEICKFNVEAYSDSEDFCTSLMEGSVRVSDKGNPSETLVLAPNQQVSLINGHLQSKSIADFDPFRWKEGLICFKDMNFKELMSRFEKCYGIHVIIENPKLTDYICSGKFRISDGIDKALHILQKDAKYTFERNKDESVIYIK